MFETPQTAEKSSGAGMWIVLSIVIVLAIVGSLAYMNRDTSAKSATPMAAAAAPTQANADPVKDLRRLGIALRLAFAAHEVRV